MVGVVLRPVVGLVQLLDRLAAHTVPRHGVVLAHQIPQPFGALSVRENLLVAAQARTRLAGHTPDGATRLVSLHDPDARLIRKGRLGKPVEFGYKA